MKTIISSLLTAMVTLAAVNGHAQSDLSGPQVATVKNGGYEILIPTDRIQTGLKRLFGPSKQDITIRSVSVISYEDHLYLQVTGAKHEICLIPLAEKDGALFEMIGLETRIVLCAGNGDGCQPLLTENGWRCSDSTGECVKSVAVTDHSIFE